VGGIPELLEEEDMVPPDDPPSLAAKIEEVIVSPERRRHMSERNINRALDYRPEILQMRREEFLAELKKRTEAWLRKRSG
jgi:glycosyltransferase involved in cell wall biosynthesis